MFVSGVEGDIDKDIVTAMYVSACLKANGKDLTDEEAL
jgi:hypothetical protein